MRIHALSFLLGAVALFAPSARADHYIYSYSGKPFVSCPASGGATFSEIVSCDWLSMTNPEYAYTGPSPGMTAVSGWLSTSSRVMPNVGTRPTDFAFTDGIVTLTPQNSDWSYFGLETLDGYSFYFWSFGINRTTEAGIRTFIGVGHYDLQQSYDLSLTSGSSCCIAEGYVQADPGTWTITHIDAPEPAGMLTLLLELAASLSGVAVLRRTRKTAMQL